MLSQKSFLNKQSGYFLSFYKLEERPRFVSGDELRAFMTDDPNNSDLLDAIVTGSAAQVAGTVFKDKKVGEVLLTKEKLARIGKHLESKAAVKPLIISARQRSGIEVDLLIFSLENESNDSNFRFISYSRHAQDVFNKKTLYLCREDFERFMAIERLELDDSSLQLTM
ncbi:MAG: hypothetical protein K0U37_00205 [Gammaproteobacteria bacterium]|nr:hypothetical protein [Gammaproteobacteria bacterium]